MFNGKSKRSFFERITGSISVTDSDQFDDDTPIKNKPSLRNEDDWISTDDEIEETGELAIDVYQTPTDVVVQAMIAGVKPENININIARQSITIEGRRERQTESSTDGYVKRELYWGSFARTVELPSEVEPDNAEAFEKHGLLTIKIPRIDKDRIQKVKIRTI
ncbi:MAG: Hsp20/alpha crystallin family protein [Patescibacteria group bacterium]